MLVACEGVCCFFFSYFIFLVAFPFFLKDSPKKLISPKQFPIDHEVNSHNHKPTDWKM